MRKVYLTQQEMLKFMKEKRQDSLSPTDSREGTLKLHLRDWSLLIPGTMAEGNIIFSPKNS